MLIAKLINDQNPVYILDILAHDIAIDQSPDLILVRAVIDGFLRILLYDLAQVGEEFEVTLVFCNLRLGDRRVFEE